MTIDHFPVEEIQWCELCRQHVDGECDTCHTKFEATDQKYLSQSHHFHPGSIAGVPASLAINKVLCVDCYRKDWTAVYKQPPPPLPDRGQDPQFFATQQLVARRRRLLGFIAEGTLSEVGRQELRELVQQAVK